MVAENHSKRVVGILGGMGPAATHDLFGRIIKLNGGRVDEEHLNLQIDCNPFSGLNQGLLCERAIRLEKIGAELIAMPCNTAHIHYDAIQAAVNIPVLNMIREGVQALRQLDPLPKKVGILAWHETLTAGLYHRELEAQGFTVVAPVGDEILATNALIQAVNGGAVTEEIRQAAIDTGNAVVKRGAEAIILGCTELPLALSSADFEVPIIDTTQILAQAVVREAIKP